MIYPSIEREPLSWQSLDALPVTTVYLSQHQQIASSPIGRNRGEASGGKGVGFKERSVVDESTFL